jgi:predicted short-subunit dehydrogenase-like oxidoreductase (DUF2520 family)
MTKFLVIGAGKLAKHLNHYLNLLELPASSWDRSQDLHLIKSRIAESTHVLLAISDSAIESFYRKYLEGHDKVVVHFSGALNIEGLIAAHPLMTFGPDLYELEAYRRVHFAVTGVLLLSQALPGLPNSFFVLEADQKPLYHALCVMGGNFPTILWQKMFTEFKRMGIPADAADVYLENVLKNVLKSPEAALTGPLARKDLATVQKNIEALINDPFQEIYIAFVRAVAPELIAQKDGPR